MFVNTNHGGGAMRRFLRSGLSAVFVALVFTVVSNAAAETPEGFLSYQHEVPKVLVKVDISGHLAAHPLKTTEVHSFSGFSLGGSLDLPPKEVERLRQVLAGVKNGQYVFIQGRADDHRWHRSYTKKEYDRLDLSLAMTRAEWARGIARQAYILMPVLERNVRGFDLYIATYGEAVPLKHEAAQPAPRSGFTPDTIWVSFKGKLVAIGGGVGWAYVQVHDRAFSCPTVSLVFKKKAVEISLTVGWRPIARPQSDVWGDRAQSLAGAELTWWHSSWLGFSGGLNGVWETLRDNDQFTERAFGLYLGPKLSRRGKNFAAEAGPNFQMLNFSGTGGSSWQIGYGLAVRLQYFL